MKKFFILGMGLFTILIVIGCSPKSSKQSKYYDEQYIKALSSGLDARWQYSDSESSKKDKPIDSLTKSTKIEYDPLKKDNFSDKKFHNTKLKELSLSYENELKNGLDILDSATEASLIDSNSKWMVHYNNRTKILTEINNIKKIPVKNEKILKELINNGKSVKENDELKTKLEENMSKVVFSAKPQEYPSEYKTYESIVSNDTATNFKYFSANVYLEDQNGTRIDTQYISANDWEAGQKVTFTFMTDKVFTTSKVVVNNFEVVK